MTFESNINRIASSSAKIPKSELLTNNLLKQFFFGGGGSGWAGTYANENESHDTKYLFLYIKFIKLVLYMNLL